LGNLGHTHVDTYETDVYETTKPGLGSKIKNVFRKLTGGNKEEEEYEATTYGPHGERIHEKEKFERKY